MVQRSLTATTQAKFAKMLIAATMTPVVLAFTAPENRPTPARTVTMPTRMCIHHVVTSNWKIHFCVVA